MGSPDADTTATALERILTALILVMVQADGVQFGTRAPAIRTLLTCALAARDPTDRSHTP